jgi:hypothetical protein
MVRNFNEQNVELSFKTSKLESIHGMGMNVAAEHAPIDKISLSKLPQQRQTHGNICPI